MTDVQRPDPFADSDPVLSAPISLGFGERLDIVQSLASIGFLRGDEPFSCSTRAEGTMDVEALFGLDGAEVARLEEHIGPRSRWSACVRGARWSAHVQANRSNVHVDVYGDERSTTAEACRRLVRMVQAVDGAPTDEQVSIAFHYLGERGVSTERRMIDAPSWSEISANYPHGALDAMESLMSLSGSPSAGRLALLHGPPGTGKTTAIRALARSWHPWCDTSYVMDPEVLFSRTSYLHQLVLDGDSDLRHFHDDDDDGDDESMRRWRLLVVEDADEIIAGDARDRAGQALSRLLNLTDGLLGQGLRTLVLITTNEPMSSLHPALTRPGRCLAEVEIGPFDRASARRWLGDEEAAVPAGGATLAELFALRDGVTPLRHREDARGVGTYL